MPKDSGGSASGDRSEDGDGGVGEEKPPAANGLCPLESRFTPRAAEADGLTEPPRDTEKITTARNAMRSGPFTVATGSGQGFLGPKSSGGRVVSPPVPGKLS